MCSFAGRGGRRGKSGSDFECVTGPAAAVGGVGDSLSVNGSAPTFKSTTTWLLAGCPALLLCGVLCALIYHSPPRYLPLATGIPTLPTVVCCTFRPRRQYISPPVSPPTISSHFHPPTLSLSLSLLSSTGALPPRASPCSSHSNAAVSSRVQLLCPVSVLSTSHLDSSIHGRVSLAPDSTPRRWCWNGFWFGVIGCGGGS